MLALLALLSFGCLSLCKNQPYKIGFNDMGNSGNPPTWAGKSLKVVNRKPIATVSVNGNRLIYANKERLERGAFFWLTILVFNYILTSLSWDLSIR